MKQHKLDPRLDWHPRHDPRSRGYSVADVIDKPPVLKKCWRGGQVLDQGREGACVGYAWAAELSSSPFRAPLVDGLFARRIYQEARKVDEWEGEAYEGTSVLAGAKVVRKWGWIKEYRWSFSIEDLRDAVLTLGPAVVGIPWLRGMYEPRPSGLLDVSGPVVGGHAILITGYHPGMRIQGEGWHERHAVFTLRNSWGEDYGNRGNIYMREADLGGLLADDGEACVPLQRYRKGSYESAPV